MGVSLYVARAYECVGVCTKAKTRTGRQVSPSGPPLRYLERGPFADWQLAAQAKLAVQ